MSKTIELKSCPFCGKAPFLEENDRFVWVECEACGGRTHNIFKGIKNPERVAARKWNSRPGDTYEVEE